MGSSQRAKGARGQCEARKVLEGKGYYVETLTCGLRSADLIAELDGQRYLVEVKNHAAIKLADFLKQARDQARKAGVAWMLMVKLPTLSRWLVVTAEYARLWDGV